MKIKIVSVGDPKTKWVREGEEEYIKRIKHYLRLSIDSIKGEKITVSRPDTEIITSESQRMLQIVQPTGAMIVLDLSGKQVSSEGLAEMFGAYQNRAVQEIAFCIGGPLGFDSTLRKEADFVLSLSKMTLPHELCRLVLLEQIYRALTILRGEKYHK